jgi:hypothetical protein
MYKIIYFVPEEYKEKTKNALFAVGAGRYKNYECCSFESRGTGQFRPIKNANPYIGKQNTLTKITEYKVEMICPDIHLKKCIKTLKETHPYEEVALDVIKLKNY